MSRTAQTTTRIGLAVLGAVFLTSSSVLAEPDKLTTFGAKAGLYSPGTVYPETGGELDGSLGISLGGFIDYMLGEKISGGASLDLHNVGVETESEMMIEFGMNLKAHISQPASKFAVRPGFGIGYASMGGNEFIDGTQYFIAKGFSEFLIKSTGAVSFLGEIGLGYATGGNGDIGVEAGPTFMIRGGLIVN